MRTSLVFLTIFVAAAGCGPRPVAVHGAVSFDGKPVDRGMIVFESGDGTKAEGLIADGVYKCETVTPGKKTVRINGTRKTGRKIDSGPLGPGKDDEWVPFIPAQFNSSSTLRVEIAGEGEHDFHLRSDRK